MFHTYFLGLVRGAAVRRAPRRLRHGALGAARPLPATASGSRCGPGERCGRGLSPATERRVDAGHGEPRSADGGGAGHRPGDAPAAAARTLGSATRPGGSGWPRPRLHRRSRSGGSGWTGRSTPTGRLPRHQRLRPAGQRVGAGALRGGARALVGRARRLGGRAARLRAAGRRSTRPRSGPAAAAELRPGLPRAGGRGGAGARSGWSARTARWPAPAPWQRAAGGRPPRTRGWCWPGTASAATTRWP